MPIENNWFKLPPKPSIPNKSFRPKISNISKAFNNAPTIIVKTIGAYGALDTTMNIEAIPAETKTIKAYVWNSVENITPLCQNSVATLAVQ